MRRILALTIAFATATTFIAAEQSQPASATYQLPPQAIVDILDAAPPPTPIGWRSAS